MSGGVGSDLDRGIGIPWAAQKQHRCFERAFRRSTRLEGDRASHVHAQVPLQPLQDNLESQTYEVFEKDTTKYVMYEDAILLALREVHPERAGADAGDRPAPEAGAAQPNGRATEPGGSGRAVVIMVVGAGRGPLVRASLQAGQRAGRPVRVYAVEKNPNAIITLHCLVAARGCAGRCLPACLPEQSLLSP